MLAFNRGDHARVVSGELTVTWRLWKYAHVRAGRSYATGWGGGVDIEDVRQVRVTDVTDEDARESGLPDAQALIELARSHTGAAVSPGTLLYRVQFRYLDQAPERPQLAPAEVRTRLERLDRASPRGPWTLRVLRLIEANPGVVSRELAAEAFMHRDEFKANVRKLKTLGLTTSLDVGYTLSESGQAYLDGLPRAP